MVGHGVEAWAALLRESRSRRRLGEVFRLPGDVTREMWTVWGAWRGTEMRQGALGPQQAWTSHPPAWVLTAVSVVTLQGRAVGRGSDERSSHLRA